MRNEEVGGVLERVEPVNYGRCLKKTFQQEY